MESDGAGDCRRAARVLERMNMLCGTFLMAASLVLQAPPVSEDDASSIARTLLESRGVAGPVICEVHRIEAPLAGYLVDALGSLVVDGIEFSTFRIGVRDGSEQECGDFNAGDEFVFIARGIDAPGPSSGCPHRDPIRRRTRGWSSIPHGSSCSTGSSSRPSRRGIRGRRSRSLRSELRTTGEELRLRSPSHVIMARERARLGYSAVALTRSSWLMTASLATSAASRPRPSATLRP